MGRAVYLGLCLLGCLLFNPSVEAQRGVSNDKVAAKSPCSQGATPFKSNCYEFFRYGLPCDIAEKECQNLGEGAHLVSIENFEEAKFLSSYFKHQRAGNRFWIGLGSTFDGWSQNWKWSSGAQYNPNDSFWGGWTPSNSKPQCVAYSLSGSPKWTQLSCSNALPYVCKYRAFY